MMSRSHVSIQPLKVSRYESNGELKYLLVNFVVLQYIYFKLILSSFY